MQLKNLVSALDTLLQADLVKDYCPNGLQIEGRHEIKKIVTGVTASQALIDEALAKGADALLVHHGYFWKNEPYPIVGMKKRRISTLLHHDINLIAYHLPLDIHPTLGNNAQLARMLELEDLKAIDSISPVGIVMQGRLKQPMSHKAFAKHLESRLNRQVVSVELETEIQRVAWCTGGGQGYIDAIAEIDAQTHETIDAFISGEISEQTTHSAREQNMHYFAVGHHASERYGVKALGEYLKSEYALDVEFVDIDNPA